MKTLIQTTILLFSTTLAMLIALAAWLLVLPAVTEDVGFVAWVFYVTVVGVILGTSVPFCVVVLGCLAAKCLRCERNL